MKVVYLTDLTLIVSFFILLTSLNLFDHLISILLNKIFIFFTINTSDILIFLTKILNEKDENKINRII